MQRPKSIVVVITGQVQAEKVQLRVCQFLDANTPLLPLDRCCDRQALSCSFMPHLVLRVGVA